MKKKEVRINIRLTKELREKYKTYCLENNLDMSMHIRKYIEKILKL